MLRFFFIFIILASLVGNVHAASDSSSPTYSPRLELGGKFDHHRNLGMTKLMIPLKGNEDGVFFTDWRARIDDNDTTEYNAGLGYRSLLKDELIIGVYGFYDRLKSSYDHYFNQMTLGVECLTEDWDFRINGYLPENKKVLTDSLSTLEINGSSILVRAGYEKPLPGFDAEVGYRLPIEAVDLRFFLGGYYFYAGGFKTVAGPRSRLELTVNDLPIRLIPRDAEVTFGLEFQKDNIRNEQLFSVFKIRIPFGKGSGTARPVRSLSNRMMNFIERDVDVITGSQLGAEEPVSIEGRTVTSVLQINPGDDIDSTMADSSTDQLVIVSGAQAPAATITLQEGQVLAGGGATVTAQGLITGTTFGAKLPGARPTITSTVNGVNILEMADSTTAIGLNFLDGNAASDGIYVSGVNDVTLSDLIISNTDNGINIDNGAEEVDLHEITINNVASRGLLINGIGLSVADVNVDNFTVNSMDTGIDIFGANNDLIFNNVELNDSSNVGFSISDATNVAMTDVIVHNSVSDAFLLGNQITNLTGLRLAATGIIGGSVCNTIWMNPGSTASLSFIDGTTYP